MDRSQSLFTPVLIGGCVVILISFAIRASFGVFQIPVAEEFGWLRAEFSLAIAVQNLAWGFGQPIFGAIAEKFGDRRAVVLGALLYAAGLIGSAYAITPGQHQLLEVAVGFGVAGTGLGLVLAIVGRAATDETRSMALGITTAAGSAGQVVGPPLAEGLMLVMSWQAVFLVFAGLILATLFALPLMRAPQRTTAPHPDETLTGILATAARDRSFALIFIGFFSCGYQLGFVTAHFPALITDFSSAVRPGSVLYQAGITSTSALGALSISLIGLANIGGTLAAGMLGRYFPRKYLLAGIYVGRTLAAALFIMFPITPLSVVLFSLTMGSLWLATVPLTSGLVGYIYGLRYMGTLYGIVFFSHQLGSFLGIWLGGRLFDLYGDYTLVWWVGVAVGALSAVVHLPIREEPLTRPVGSGAAL